MFGKLKKVIHYDYIRRSIFLFFRRIKLKNKDFTLIASNCAGGAILHDLKLRFNTPFINLKIGPKDFIVLLKNLKYYMDLELKFKKINGISYPIGVLGDIEIHFVHYDNESHAYAKWNERKKRINYNNLFVLFTDREGCTLEQMKEYDQLDYKNKVLFTNKKDIKLKSAYYLKGFENQNSVGMIMHYMPKQSHLKYYDQFNYVKWFNKGFFHNKY